MVLFMLAQRPTRRAAGRGLPRLENVSSPTICGKVMHQQPQLVCTSFGHAVRRSLVLTLAFAWGHASAASLCTSQEDTLFDCPSGSKRISICASRPWSAHSGWVQYRYGTPNKVEIKVPADATSQTPDKTVVVGEQALAGGGLDFVRFTSGRYDYTVYSAISENGLIGGVAIDEDGSNIGERRCMRGSEGEFPAGLTHSPGLPQSAKPFYLP